MAKLKKREPEVVVFEEPKYSRKPSREAAKEKDVFLRGNVSEVFQTIRSGGSVKTKAQVSDSEFDLQATLREVQSLAASSFTGKTRRKFEDEQIKALGAKPQKPEYVPYPHLQMVNRARRAKEKRLEEEQKQAMGKRKKRKARTNTPIAKGRGRWKDSIKTLEPAVGKFKGGVLKLSGKHLPKSLTRKE